MLSRLRRDQILMKLAEKQPPALPLIRSDSFDPKPVELKDRRPSVGDMLNQRFGNVQMSEEGPTWRREFQTRVPGLSVTSSRPVDLRVPAMYGAKYQAGDDTSVGLQYPLGGIPRATLQTALGGGDLTANLQGQPTAPGQGQYRLGANYTFPLKVPGIKDAELEVGGNVEGRAGTGASLVPNYGVNVAFGGKF